MDSLDKRVTYVMELAEKLEVAAHECISVHRALGVSDHDIQEGAIGTLATILVSCAQDMGMSVEDLTEAVRQVWGTAKVLETAHPREATPS